jgi:hypothetical protein
VTDPVVDDAMLASIELVQRSGATGFEVGYLDENPANPRWWAKAQYRGARLQVDEHRTPAAAVDALAARILEGGMCATCRLTGTTAAEIDRRAAAGLAPGRDMCLWARHGRHWVAGCLDPAAEAARLESPTARRQPGQPLNRAARRRAAREANR